jgi:V/A-type H+-transporting ATPase subunit E
MSRVDELESAILARAHSLAAEYRKRAERSRGNILREAGERLHLREEREVLIAKALAERAYRRKVQASELKLHKQMDQLRWNLVQGITERLAESMTTLVADEQRYLPLLRAYIAQGAEAIERDELVAEVNAVDRARLEPTWDRIAAEAAPSKRLKLHPEPIATLGGVLIRSGDNRIRLDNTFEGRLWRLHERLHQQIVERLLPASSELGLSFADQ